MIVRFRGVGTPEAILFVSPNPGIRTPTPFIGPVNNWVAVKELKLNYHNGYI